MTELKANSTTLKDVIVLGPEAPEGAVTFSSLLQEGKPSIGNPPVGSILIFFYILLVPRQIPRVCRLPIRTCWVMAGFVRLNSR